MRTRSKCTRPEKLTLFDLENPPEGDDWWVIEEFSKSLQYITYTYFDCTDLEDAVAFIEKLKADFLDSNWTIRLATADDLPKARYPNICVWERNL